jgi:DNA-binding LytR/AlgR family response regulator
MQEILKIAICEDTDEDASRLISYIEDININVDITRFEAGEDMLVFLDDSKGVNFDLIFLDIYMKELDGMDTARELRGRGVTSRIIFTTTSPEFSLDAFDVDAEQYLLKPLKRDGKLEKILTKHLQNKMGKISVDANGDIIEINPNNIMYIESEGHNCIIHTPEEIIETGRGMTMENFEKLLIMPSLTITNFIRCHRSYIVNFSYVSKLDEDFTMKNGDTVYIRRGDFSKIKKAYLTWLLEDAADRTL